ncbi:MAG: hypothetical protein ABFS02_06595 [Pseudomonadota bacterium]
MRSKYSFLLAILFILGIYAFQTKAVIPAVMKIVNSELFTGDPARGGDAVAISNEKTAMAYIHCNNHVSHACGSPDATEFPTKNHKVWDIGFGRYLVNSQFNLKNAGGIYQPNTYVCEIRYLGGDDSDANSWALMGLDYNHS